MTKEKESECHHTRSHHDQAPHLAHRGTARPQAPFSRSTDGGRRRSNQGHPTKRREPSCRPASPPGANFRARTGESPPTTTAAPWRWVGERGSGSDSESESSSPSPSAQNLLRGHGPRGEDRGVGGERARERARRAGDEESWEPDGRRAPPERGRRAAPSQQTREGSKEGRREGEPSL